MAREAQEKALRTAWEREDTSIKWYGTNIKLRNKKTGDIGDYLCAIQDDDIKLWSATNSYETYHYKYMSEFINEWEDYKPVEPIIEDPKSRKVFREWAELLGAKCFRVEHLCKYGRTIITSTDLIPKPVIVLLGYIGEDLGTYTREELCGERNKCRRRVKNLSCATSQRLPAHRQ